MFFSKNYSWHLKEIVKTARECEKDLLNEDKVLEAQAAIENAIAYVNNKIAKQGTSNKSNDRLEDLQSKLVAINQVRDHVRAANGATVFGAAIQAIGDYRRITNRLLQS